MQRVWIFGAGLLLGVLAGFLIFEGGEHGAGSPREVLDTPAEVLENEPLAGSSRSDEPSRAPAEVAIRKEARELDSPEPSRPTIDHIPAFGTLVYGQAFSRDGSAIPACSIWFTDPEDRSRRFSAQVVEGHGYSLTGLSPGTWKVFSKPKDHVEFSTEIVILDQPTQRVDFTFDPSFLVTVKLLTPEGKPLVEALRAAREHRRTEVTVVGSTEPFSGPLPMTELRSHQRFGPGSWRSASNFGRPSQEPAPAGVAGHLELTVPPPIYVAAVFRHIVLASEAVAFGQREVVLTVSLDDIEKAQSTIRVQVVDAATGDPIAGASVGLSDSQSGGGGRPCDEEGRVTFENERVGILELDIRAKDYEQYHKLLRIDPGEHDLGQIGLSRSRAVRLAIVDSEGVPAGGVTAHWQNLDRRDLPQPSRYRRSSTSNAEGLIELGGLGEGRYLVQVYVRGGGRATRVFHTAEVGEEPIRIQLSPAYDIRVGVTMPEPRTALHCLTIYDLAKVPVWAVWLKGHETSVTLVEGSYTWELHDGEELIDRGELVVRAGEPLPEIVPR